MSLSTLVTPFVRNATGASLLFVAADGVAQYMEQRNSGKGQNSRGYEWWDPWRGTGAAILGVILGGGVYPAAYARLDHLLPGRSWRTLLIKSAVEIVTVGITVNTASLLGRATWQGTHSWQAVGDHVRTEIPHVTLMDAQVWFPYNMLAFGFIPIQIRPLTTACVEASWQTWISLRAHDFPDVRQPQGHS